MFEPEVLYYEKRYSRLAAKNAELAQNAVKRLIREQEMVDYDECWAEALQFATIREAHLREWLFAAERRGEIRILGRTKPKEVLKIKRGHRIELSDAP